jgi:glucan phosphoethanolaminetransferase (alkaline phosphatase superfamily)
MFNFVCTGLFLVLERYSYRATTGVVSISIALVTLFSLCPGIKADGALFADAVDTLQKERKQFFAEAPILSIPPLVQSPGKRNLSAVVFIGESTSKWNVSLYGYPRATFAPLHELVDNFIIFDDVVAPQTQTVPSLAETLTSRNFDPTNAFENASIPLIPVLTTAGVKTWWFSNQIESDDSVSRHGKMADYTYFHRKTVGKFLGGDFYDSDMISIALNKVKQLSPRSALFLHTYSSHSPYCEIIPRPTGWKQDVLSELPDTAIFGRFKGDRARLDCYDSAVRYVAENLRMVIDWIASQNDPIILIYFPDHGEDIFEGKGHESSKFTHKMVDVPLLVYFNNAAKKEFPDIAQNLTVNKHKPLDLSRVFDLVLDLFGIELQGYSILEKSIASARFQPADRFIVDRKAEGLVSYDDPHPSSLQVPDLADSYVAQRRLLRTAITEAERQRVCAHRNNSLIKFMEAASLFDCIEMDVTIDEVKQTAFIHHDADDPTGLPLSTLLSLKQSRGKRLWLDVKNLSDRNVGILLSTLNAANRSKHDMLVEVSESTAGSTAVKLLSQAGYQVSYYLPTDPAIECAADFTLQSCSEMVSKVEEDLKIGFSSLSFDYRAMPFVSRLQLPPGVSISTWDLRDLTLALTDLHERKDIEAFNMFIVPFKSPFHH